MDARVCVLAKHIYLFRQILVIQNKSKFLKGRVHVLNRFGNNFAINFAGVRLKWIDGRPLRKMVRKYEGLTRMGNSDFAWKCHDHVLLVLDAKTQL